MSSAPYTRTPLTWEHVERGDVARTDVGTYTVGPGGGPAPDELGVRVHWVAIFEPDVRGARAMPLGNARIDGAHPARPGTRAAARARAQEHYDALMRGELV